MRSVEEEEEWRSLLLTSVDLEVLLGRRGARGLVLSPFFLGRSRGLAPTLVTK